MTHAECEIVANAGVQLREIAERLTVPPGLAIADARAIAFVHLMDAAALSISEVYGQLSALPLENEREREMKCCEACRGFGIVRPAVETKAFGPLEQCPACGGTGAIEVEGEAGA